MLAAKPIVRCRVEHPERIPEGAATKRQRNNNGCGLRSSDALPRQLITHSSAEL